ncbi:39S ribosomal protein L44, mitochondrial [Sporothrix eucalyptigena]|uniref:Large ribosomal subunit protein mL53 n=1 Tax=Sporothrix eucalyptigena TaxID=1812306 RepID=A0ABP0B0J0_9PEZI
MLTRFITEVTTRFNPFSVKSKAARLFLTQLPPNVRQEGTVINTELLPRHSTEPSTLTVKFKDGKVMKLDCEEMGIKRVVEEVDRHSRALQKQADLADG